MLHRLTPYVLALLLASACTPDSQTGAGSSAEAEALRSEMAAKAAAEQALLDLRLLPNAVGRLRPGMSLDSVRVVLPQAQVRETLEEGHKYLERIDSTGRPLLRLRVTCKAPDPCLVAQIDVLSPLYNTPEGLGVGLTLEEVQKLAELGEPHWTDALGLTIEVPKLGALLVFDASELPDELVEKPVLAKLPKDLIVERIIVGTPLR